MDQLNEMANRLDTTEFELFRIAYHAWYGAWPDERELEYQYGSYLRSPDRAPAYVRNLLRRPPYLLA